MDHCLYKTVANSDKDTVHQYFSSQFYMVVKNQHFSMHNGILIVFDRLISHVNRWHAL